MQDEGKAASYGIYIFHRFPLEITIVSRCTGREEKNGKKENE
jgi:hypothetical protein